MIVSWFLAWLTNVWEKHPWVTGFVTMIIFALVFAFTLFLLGHWVQAEVWEALKEHPHTRGELRGEFARRIELDHLRARVVDLESPHAQTETETEAPPVRR